MYNEIVNTCVCDSGYYIIEGVCGVCKSGYNYNSANQKCQLRCEVNQIYSLAL